MSIYHTLEQTHYYWQHDARLQVLVARLVHTGTNSCYNFEQWHIACHNTVKFTSEQTHLHKLFTRTRYKPHDITRYHIQEPRSCSLYSLTRTKKTSTGIGIIHTNLNIVTRTNTYTDRTRTRCHHTPLTYYMELHIQEQVLHSKTYLMHILQKNEFPDRLLLMTQTLLYLVTLTHTRTRT